jgi:Ca-activated chloride channel family protein
MNHRKRRISLIAGSLGFVCAFVIAVVFLTTGHGSLVTFFLNPDQGAHRYYLHGDYKKAAELFNDPMWKGTAYFKLGEFASAANQFMGMDTAEAAYNHGNALVMQGRYDEAVGKYDRALELKPAWEDAVHNRDLALSRAEFLRKEGSEMTGGQLGADEIVFSEGKTPPSAQEEQIQGQQQIGDEEIRAMWLRNVQTKPADFLRAKFAYQYAQGKRE